MSCSLFQATLQSLTHTPLHTGIITGIEWQRYIQLVNTFNEIDVQDRETKVNLSRLQQLLCSSALWPQACILKWFIHGYFTPQKKSQIPEGNVINRYYVYVCGVISLWSYLKGFDNIDTNYILLTYIWNILWFMACLCWYIIAMELGCSGWTKQQSDLKEGGDTTDKIQLHNALQTSFLVSSKVHRGSVMLRDRKSVV